MTDPNLVQLADRLAGLLLSDARLGQMAQRVAGLLLDDPRMRLIIREVALRLEVEREQRRVSGVVREFLRACEARRIEVVYDLRTGVVVVAPLERLSDDMLLVLRERREEITAFVKGRQS